MMDSSQYSTKKTILITGAGGVAVPNLIRLMQAKGYRVLAADMDENSAGLYAADKGVIIPAGGSSDFYSALRKICRQENVSAVIPLVDEELVTVSLLESEGVAILLPRVPFIKICLDKYVLMQQLDEHGVKVPYTRLASSGINGLKFPFIVKPRTGRGSRGFAIINSEADFNEYLDRHSYDLDELLLQDYIDGTEFTVSVVVWRRGLVQAVVPKEIIDKRGVTRVAVTRKNPQIDMACRLIQEKLKADGPFNVQLKVDKETGQPYVFEINPRFSTSVSLTIAAGVDEVNEVLSQALMLNRDCRIYPEWKEGIVLLRSTFEEFVDEQEYLECKKLFLKSQR